MRQDSVSEEKVQIVRNLAAIASGVEQGVPLESIMSNLIKPE